MRRSVSMFASPALMAALAACAAPMQTQTAPAPAPAASAPSAPIQSAEIVGHWTGDWGDMHLRQDADGTVRGIYTHDDGSVVGRIEGGVFRGWWCEAPSRQADADAGDVELTFGRDAQGLFLDGRWRYGSSAPEWRDDWDLRWTETAADPALDAQFANAARFCRHP